MVEKSMCKQVSSHLVVGDGRQERGASLLVREISTSDVHPVCREFFFPLMSYNRESNVTTLANFWWSASVEGCYLYFLLILKTSFKAILQNAIISF